MMALSRPLRVELHSRDDFWRKAVAVEWAYQFPDRIAIAEAAGTYVIEAEWLQDFSRVAGKCFSEVRLAPADPGRRSLFRRILTSGAKR
jgi:hypothetical protein